MMVRPRRSALFMSGLDAHAHELAKTSAADCLVFDLEDAVTSEAKGAARERVAASLRGGGYGAREKVVRINASESPWALDDLRVAVAAGADAILIPRAERPGDIMRAAKDLREAGAAEHVRLWAMIETPTAILALDSTLRTAVDPSSRLDVVVIGIDDLAREIRGRLRPGRAGLLSYLSLSVAAARAYGLDILDGCYPEAWFPDDGDGFQTECEQGRDLGMDGKSLTDFAQIALCNAVFEPQRTDGAGAAQGASTATVSDNAKAGVVRREGHTAGRGDDEVARRPAPLKGALATRR